MAGPRTRGAAAQKSVPKAPTPPAPSLTSSSRVRTLTEKQQQNVEQHAAKASAAEQRAQTKILRARQAEEEEFGFRRVNSDRLRSDAKKMASGKVEGFYSLVPGDECKEIVKDITSMGGYIFPKTASGSLNKKKPFGHPAALSSLKEYAFTGARGTLADRLANSFSSIIEDGPGADEPEIPAPMLCIIATAIHAALDDWSTGYLRKTDFIADEYEDVYRGHALFLQQIREAKPAAYHHMMADLYTQVSAKESRSAVSIANNAMAILDLDAMDV
ncbi:hypothetical protein LshimejAT787_2500560 [Lyophyllum shimeji]|uniref:DUF6532 domain-containing protein n=1 Tax=Lyophyllum shimeji TaxID=47721 RepID=A0A9P3Q1W7_LYOSH|nr:hypothetical protein LshimejAT787_2500560 [Lyophyllum shimeji]